MFLIRIINIVLLRLFFFHLNQIIFPLKDVLYESIVDETAYETTEYVTSEAKDTIYEEPNAIATKGVTTKVKNPTFIEPYSISTEYCHPNTALKNINFSHYNLPDHSLLQSYKSMRKDHDKLFAAEYKVGKILVLINCLDRSTFLVTHCCVL